jgi:hypothetical protein
MKKILYTGIALLTALHFYSCSDDYLHTVSTDQYNEANWWQTENQAISSINGIYAALRNTNISGVQNLREENLTPNSYSMGGDSPLDVGAHNPGNVSRFRDKWNACYSGVGRANDFLANIDKVPMDDALIQRLKGEAYFLRAYFYSNLVNYFGGVPLILDAPDFAVQGKLPRNTREEVINQVLVDLDNAASILPLSYSAPGRATKGAALALKSRVLLYESRWAEAAQTAKAVMDLNEYGLFPDYRGLFLLPNENNEEVIFDVQYKTPEYTHALDIIIELQMNVAPTMDLVDSYLMKDGLPISESTSYDPAQPYENRDPRLHQTVVIPGYMYRGGIVSDTKYFSTGFGFKKYTTYQDNVAQPSLLQSEINLILLRYGDVLLMYAEAQNEATGPDESVYLAMNQIRARAGMPNLPAGLDKDQMREVIRHERRIELAGEALYLHDIRRWRTAEVNMNAEVLNSKREVIQVRSFNPARDYLWPIHEITIQENPALEQNDNY